MFYKISLKLYLCYRCERSAGFHNNNCDMCTNPDDATLLLDYMENTLAKQNNEKTSHSLVIVACSYSVRRVTSFRYNLPKVIFLLTTVSTSSPIISSSPSSFSFSLTTFAFLLFFSILVLMCHKF